MRGPRLRLIDVVVLLGCALLVLAYITPMLTETKHWVYWTSCASNLRQIGQAMLLYSLENRNALPKTRHDRTSSAVRSYTNPNATNPFADDGPEPNDVTACLYLLRRTQQINPSAFVCPNNELGAAFVSSPTTQPLRSNFAGQHELSYSLANPFASEDALKKGYKWNNSISAEFALAADMNPGDAAMRVTAQSSANALRKANTLNHGAGAGQLVLYGDGHVEKMESPFVGRGLDNIYTYGASGNESPGIGVVGPPVGPDDSVLLPIATVDPIGHIDPYTRVRQRREMLSVIWFITLSAFSITFGAWVWRYVRRRRAMMPGTNVQ